MRKLLPILSVALTVVGCTSPNYPKSDHFDGERFFNPSGKKPKGFFTLLKWWREPKAEWPSFVEVKERELPEAPQGEDLHITFINHATFYIRGSNFSLLADPHFTKRASPVGFAGPKRVHNPPIALKDLPSVDYVFISHNHYDHLDLPTLKLLKKAHPEAVYIVPLGNERLLKEVGIQKVVALDWWQSFVDPNRKLHFDVVPAEHWSARGLFDRNKNLWGGLLLRTETKKVFFAGDTGYGTHFKTIFDRFGAVDAALLPIGAYEPRWFMQDFHMNPDDAVRAHMDLQSKFSVGKHFGCFQLTNEAIDQPQKDLKLALEAHGVPADRFFAPSPGDSYLFK